MRVQESQIFSAVVGLLLTGFGLVELIGEARMGGVSVASVLLLLGGVMLLVMVAIGRKRR